MSPKTPDGAPAPLSSLHLILGGTLQDMDSSTVIKGLDLLTKLVKGFTDGPIRMAALEQGSAVTGVLVPPDVKAEIFDGLSTIREHHALPSHWSLGQVRNLRKLAELADSPGVESVKLNWPDNADSHVLDNDLIEAIESSLRGVTYSLGSVSGTLYSYSCSNTEKLQARLRPREGGFVNVTFNESLDQSIREALRKDVSIYGLLKRIPENYSIQEIDARDIRILNPSPSPINGLGIWREARDQGVTVEDYMRMIRGEEVEDRNYG